MRSTLYPPMRLLLWLSLMLSGFVCVPASVRAQSRDGQGAQAQSGVQEKWQGESSESRLEGQASQPAGRDAGSGYRQGEVGAGTVGLDRIMDRRLSPNRPNRPIPSVLILLGAVFVILWSASLVAMILSIGTSLAVVMLILAIVLLPLLILGVVFLIGGIIAATSGKHKAK